MSEIPGQSRHALPDLYEGENMLVIHPDECIDCGVCEPECPVDAIKPDTEPGLDRDLFRLARSVAESMNFGGHHIFQPSVWMVHGLSEAFFQGFL